MRRLIVNADDFGLTAGVNRAILEAHQKGMVTSATLMAGGHAFDDAVALSRTAPELSVGCHVVLVDGTPLLPGKTSTLLAEDRGSQSDASAPASRNAQFQRSLGKFAFSALRGYYSGEEIEAEAIAQIRKLQDGGVNVSHIDTHKHTHIFPNVLSPVLKAAKACGIRSIRNPFEPLRFSCITGEWKRAMQMGMLQIYAHNFRRLVNEAGLNTPDGSLGIVAAGVLNKKLMQKIIDAMPEGTWELVCHPGYNDAALRSTTTRLLQSREVELNGLISLKNEGVLARRSIQAVSYRDLATR